MSERVSRKSLAVLGQIMRKWDAALRRLGGRPQGPERMYSLYERVPSPGCRTEVLMPPGVQLNSITIAPAGEGGYLLHVVAWGAPEKFDENWRRLT